MDLRQLKNRYYILRHGQSLANVRGLIVSRAANGLHDFGLSEAGREQVRSAVSRWIDSGDLDRETLIIASDFLRARHTAEIAASVLGSTVPVSFTPHLRERFFGTWEKTGSENYDRVWADDAQQKTDKKTLVESVTRVLDRGLACIGETEAAHSDRDILLVSHGDILQILMTAFQGCPPHCHRELPHLETAEIRRLLLT